MDPIVLDDKNHHAHNAAFCRASCPKSGGCRKIGCSLLILLGLNPVLQFSFAARTTTYSISSANVLRTSPFTIPFTIPINLYWAGSSSPTLLCYLNRWLYHDNSFSTYFHLLPCISKTNVVYDNTFVRRTVRRRAHRALLPTPVVGSESTGR